MPFFWVSLFFWVSESIFFEKDRGKSGFKGRSVFHFYSALIFPLFRGREREREKEGEGGGGACWGFRKVKKERSPSSNKEEEKNFGFHFRLRLSSLVSVRSIDPRPTPQPLS